MNSPTLRVLVVDDNRDAAETLRLLMALHGREARAALSGPEALAVAAEFRPDVVLLDLGMPGMDGYEVARQLREIEGLGQVRLVAVTGYGGDLNRVLSQQEGFDFHVLKPADPEELDRCVTEAAARQG